MSRDLLFKMSAIEDEGEIEVDDEEEEDIPGSLDTSYSSDGCGEQVSPVM